MTDVMGVVRACGVPISVDISPRRTPSDDVVHHIRLTYLGITCVLPVDHETFMNPEFFRTLVLHQIEPAIEKLVAPGPLP